MTREMKDSGIDYIKKIPSEWSLIALKRIASFHNGDRSSNYPSGNDIQFEGVPFLTSDNIHNLWVEIKEDSKFITLAKYNSLKGAKLKQDDILFCLRGSVGSCSLNKTLDSGTIASSLTLIRPKGVKSDFLNYCLNSDYVKYQVNCFMNGSCAANLSVETIRDFYIVYPSISEQHCIANFLDSKCSEIDSLVADITKEIELLKEYRKSVIYEVVTKGLDPNVEMKDSGIEWIGEIPAHWDIKKVKHLFYRFEPKNPGNVPVLSLYREYGIVLKDSRDDNHNVTSEDTSKYKYVKPGDFVLNKMKAWQGSVAVSDFEGIVSPAYYVYHFRNDNVNKKYFHYLFRSNYKDEFRRLSGGIREGQWDLPAEAWENTLLTLPSPVEQANIVKYIDSKCSEIDSIIASKQEQIDTLKEYKKSLIYEYVTGKKEVPAV